MPNKLDVPLSYAADTAGHLKVKQPANIKVKKGDTIHFHRVAIPPDMKFMIIFDQPQFFSVANVDEGDADVLVTQNLTASVTYQCGLKGPDHKPIPNSLSGPGSGGQIDPDTGNISG
jgi:hypothetical protein